MNFFDSEKFSSRSENALEIFFFCSPLIFDGVSKTTLIKRSPLVSPWREPAPRSRNLNTFPVCVSGGILSKTFFVKVGTSISSPSIAWSILSGISQYRWFASLSKKG